AFRFLHTPMIERPSISPGQRPRETRNRFVALRLSEDEYRLLAEYSRRAGLARGGYLRAVALGSPGPRARRVPPVNIEALARAVAQLNRAGNNLNQIAKLLNAARASGAKESLEALAETRSAVAQIVAAVGRKPAS